MARKSLRDEVVMANVVNLSWTTILRALNSKKLTEVEKRGIALEVVKRTCPQRHEIGGNENGAPIRVVAYLPNVRDEK